MEALTSVRWKKNIQLPFASANELALCLLTARDGYKDLKMKFELDPTADSVNLEINNPLNQSDSNPWNQKFKDMELKTIISLDVIRTFPSIPLFQDLNIQEQLGKIIFLWCKLNPDIGYRQGMHELVAVLYYAVSKDAKAKNDPDYNMIVDQEYVEYDTGILFLSLMRSVKPWYEINHPENTNAVYHMILIKGDCYTCYSSLSKDSI